MDLTARCSGRPVTGTTKRNCPAITLDSALLPDATETRVRGQRLGRRARGGVGR